MGKSIQIRLTLLVHLSPKSTSDQFGRKPCDFLSCRATLLCFTAGRLAKGRIYALQDPRLTNIMETPAASGVKHKLRRFGSYNSGVAQYGGGGGPRENGGPTIRQNISHHVNEHTRLISSIGYNSNGDPLYNDSRPWVSYPSNFAHLTWKTLKSNWVNVLLVFVPLGIVAGATGWDPTAVFVLNFLAIIPLASLLSFATEEVSVRLGQTLGGLLNATFGNAVELIVCSP